MHTHKFTCIFRTIHRKIAPTFNEIIKQKHRSAGKSLIQLYLADQAVKKQARITSKTKYALMLSMSLSVSLSLSLSHTHTGSQAQNAEYFLLFSSIKETFTKLIIN